MVGLQAGVGAGKSPSRFLTLGKMPGNREGASISFCIMLLCMLPEIVAFSYYGNVGLSLQSNALLALRGGSGANPKTQKISLDETRLQKMLGTPYTLDMSRDQDRQEVIKLIKQHRLGGGEFNAVVLNGVDFNLPGTNSLVSEKENEHFKELKGKGQSAKGEKKPLKNTAAEILASKATHVLTNFMVTKRRRITAVWNIRRQN
eukprot:766792-Hanusia_phi.AAC.1